MSDLLNLITDVPGVIVGNADDPAAATGVTVALFAEPAVASIAVLGGAPGVRETALLEPEMTVGHVDAIVLSGGSAYGLAAASGVMAALVRQDRGYRIGPTRVPIVPEAILFDLTNGGEKPWAMGGAGEPPYQRLGVEAVAAAGGSFALGTAGAGFGARTVNLKGGLGSASTVTQSGHLVGALAAVNGVGSAVIADGPHFWAAPYEQHREYGGLGWPRDFPHDALRPRFKGGPGANTTIALVATDAILTKAEAKRLALAAHDGLAHALRPAHTPLDGDVVFAAATGHRPLDATPYALAELCLAAADCLARAIARGVYEATALPFPGAQPAWKDFYDQNRSAR